MSSNTKKALMLSEGVNALEDKQITIKYLLDEHFEAYEYYASCMNYIMIVSVCLFADCIINFTSRVYVLCIGVVAYFAISLYINRISKALLQLSKVYKNNMFNLNSLRLSADHYSNLAKFDMIINHLPVKELYTIVSQY